MGISYSWVPLVTSPYTYQTILDTGLFVGYVTNEGTPFDDKKWYASTTNSTSGVKAGYANGSLYFFSLVSSTYVPMAASTRTSIDNNYLGYSFVGTNTGTRIHYYKRWKGSDYPDAYPGPLYFNNFPAEADLFSAVDDGNWNGSNYPITYRPTNCSFPGAPTEAAVGDTVVVPVTFPDGYGLVNESNIYVTNNGVVIPSSYSNGQLTFTMPDPI